MGNRKLLGRIKEYGYTQREFADKIGLSYVSTSHRLNGKIEWRASEIASVCNLLDIPKQEVYLYFFNNEV